MFIYLYKNLTEYNPKILINNELIDIKEAKKNSYNCISGITKPCINNNLLQVVIAQILPYKEELGLTQNDENDLKRIFKKLEKENAKRC